jgi:hypothetical protein
VLWSVVSKCQWWHCASLRRLPVFCSSGSWSHFLTAHSNRHCCDRGKKDNSSNWASCSLSLDRYQPKVHYQLYFLAWSHTILLCSLTQWNRDILQKLMVTWILKTFPVFYGPYSSLPHPQEQPQVLCHQPKNPVHTLSQCPQIPILTLLSPLCLGLLSGLFPPGFPTKILYTYLIADACYMSHPS